jgi:hypothetical protein
MLDQTLGFVTRPRPERHVRLKEDRSSAIVAAA